MTPDQKQRLKELAATRTTPGYGKPVSHSEVMTLAGAVTELLAELERKTEALEFYADEEEWIDFKAVGFVEGVAYRVDSHFDNDNGKRARAALKVGG